MLSCVTTGRGYRRVVLAIVVIGAITVASLIAIAGLSRRGVAARNEDRKRRLMLAGLILLVTLLGVLAIAAASVLLGRP